jgi:hypothetical protein
MCVEVAVERYARKNADFPRLPVKDFGAGFQARDVHPTYRYSALVEHRYNKSQRALVCSRRAGGENRLLRLRT